MSDSCRRRGGEGHPRAPGPNGQRLRGATLPASGSWAGTAPPTAGTSPTPPASGCVRPDRTRRGSSAPAAGPTPASRRRSVRRAPDRPGRSATLRVRSRPSSIGSPSCVLASASNNRTSPVVFRATSRSPSRLKASCATCPGVCGSGGPTGSRVRARWKPSRPSARDAATRPVGETAAATTSGRRTRGPSTAASGPNTSYAARSLSSWTSTTRRPSRVSEPLVRAGGCAAAPAHRCAGPRRPRPTRPWSYSDQPSRWCPPGGSDVPSGGNP